MNVRAEISHLGYSYEVEGNGDRYVARILHRGTVWEGRGASADRALAAALRKAKADNAPPR